MENNQQRNKLDFFQNTRKGKILRTLTLNDLTFWATDAFVVVVLVLFVLQFIEGGSATHLGLAFLVYKGFAALFSIPIGKFFDQHKGYIDELWGLGLASFAYGGVYMVLSFATQLWVLYAAMAVLGLVATINLLSWRTLFYSNIDKAEYSETVGTYQTFYGFGQGVAIALGGLVGDTFGFDKVVFFGGLVIFLGGFLPLGLRYLVSKKKHET